jgi:hypothetical protein
MIPAQGLLLVVFPHRNRLPIRLYHQPRTVAEWDERHFTACVLIRERASLNPLGVPLRLRTRDSSFDKLLARPEQ